MPKKKEMKPGRRDSLANEFFKRLDACAKACYRDAVSTAPPTGNGLAHPKDRLTFLRSLWRKCAEPCSSKVGAEIDKEIQLSRGHEPRPFERDLTWWERMGQRVRGVKRALGFKVPKPQHPPRGAYPWEPGGWVPPKGAAAPAAIPPPPPRPATPTPTFSTGTPRPSYPPPPYTSSAAPSAGSSVFSDDEINRAR